MKSTFRSSFGRDLKILHDKKVRSEVAATIAAVEAARDLTELPQVRKLGGSQDCYRIRIGAYRIGITVDGDSVEFVRCLSRRDLYRYFP